MDKFSDRYKNFEGSLNEELAKEINSLADLFVNNIYRIIDLDENIGICAELNTQAGSRSFIRRCENVVIVINKNNWSCVPPFAFSDRLDFPYDEFPHVYYEGNKFPSTFCLTRENIQDWYSEHTLKDYILLLNEWLIDAAQGKLMKLNKDDEFEPQRYHNTTHTLIRSSYMDEILEIKEEPQCDIYSINVIESNDLPSIAYGKEHDQTINDNAIGIRLYAGNKHEDNNWYSVYPQTLQEVYDFLTKGGYHFPAGQIVETLKSPNIRFVYFQIALLRPKKIIGKNTKINYLCFRFNADDVIADNLSAKADEVMLLDCTDYLAAKSLSETPISIMTKHIVLLGCGAIGSKIAFHLHRSGINNIALVDNDFLLPHNICRHALSEYGFTSFKNKAKATKEALSKMFIGMPNGITAHNVDALDFLKSLDMEKVDLIIDATASSRVMHGIDNMDIPKNIIIVRACLSEGGDVGLTYVKHNSTCKLADFYMEELRIACDEEHGDNVYRWLKDEKRNTAENIRIGEGCHSNTMKISDDTISIHAGVISNIIRHLFEGGREQSNSIYMSYTNKEYKGSVGSERFLDIPDYLEFTCSNDADWRVRIPKDLLDDIRLKAKIKNSKETGGYLYGCLDKKRRIIYPLLHHYPVDSKMGHDRLILGSKGRKDYDKLVRDRSFGQLLYIGDWHSHPNSALEMSEIDIDTCYRIGQTLGQKPGMCIITNKNETKFYTIA